VDRRGPVEAVAAAARRAVTVGAVAATVITAGKKRPDINELAAIMREVFVPYSVLFDATGAGIADYGAAPIVFADLAGEINCRPSERRCHCAVYPN
jgi:hypothetical protein